MSTCSLRRFIYRWICPGAYVLRHLAVGCMLLIECLCGCPVLAQTDTVVSWDDFAASYAFEYAAEEGTEDVDITELLDQLYVLHLAPMDINSATRAALSQLPFLDAASADSIVSFRERYGSFYSLGELQFVRGLDFRMRQWLPLFVYCGKRENVQPAKGELWTDGKWEISGMLGVPLYRRAGNRAHSEEELIEYPNRQYLGNGLSHTLRMNYSAADRLRYGVKFEKDAGEPFAAHGNRPYDEWAFYMAYRPNSVWREVTVGDFRVNAGEGLVLGNSFLVNKGSVVASYRPPSFRVSPTLSLNGEGLFRGISTSWKRRGWAWNAFASYRKMDANLNAAGHVTSLKTDGYHRTPLERSKRRNLTATSAGLACAFDRTDWIVGMVVTGTYYDRMFEPRNALYNRYYLRGHWAGGASVYYGVHGRRWSSRGEIAVDRMGHTAMSGRLAWHAMTNWKLAVAGRKLSAKFVSPAGQTLQEGGRVANEEGLLVASDFRLPGGIEGEVYVDLFRFPWATYRASQASKGMEVSGLFAYQQGRQRTWSLRYRMRTKQRDVTGYDGLMEYVTTHRLKLAVEQPASSSRWTWQTALDCAVEQRQTRRRSMGAMWSGRLTWRPKNWRFSAMGALFFTDDYATSLSVYQPSFADTYGFVRCYYHGASTALLADWEPFEGWRVGLRYSLMAYFNRSTISSGTQQISAPTKNDFLFRLSYRFKMR